MAISSPLPSTAFSAHPLSIVLSLDGLSSGSPPQYASTSSTSAGIDVFDELDAAAGSWAPESADAPPQDLPAEPRDQPATPSDERTEVASRSATLPSDRDGAEGFVHALSDSHAALYAQGGGSGAGEEGALPGWMSETSGRVTAMASGQLRASGDCSAHWHAEQPGRGSKRRARPPLRVAVGCEDGRTWIFAPPPSSSSATGAEGSAGLAGARGEDDGGDLRRLSHDSFLSTPSTSSPPSRSPLHSPPLSPSARSRQVFAGTASPRLSSRRSSSSISTLASLQTNATARTKRVSSANASQSSTPGSAMLQSYELVRSHSRPRKASATVSISTSSAVPNHANGASRADDLPDMQLSPPAPSSPPMSPRSPTSVPQLVFSSPSRPPSLPPLGTLHSKKESASSSAAPSISSATPSRRSHSRAKDSIASGIGLWEAPSASSTEPQPGALGNPHEERTVEPSGGEGPHEHAQAAERERLGRLEAVLEIRTPGSGPVVALEIVEGLKCANKDEGVALAVLRQSGHLSIVSLLDGRTFGTCDTAVKVPSSSRAEGTRFADLQVANLAETTVAVCVGAAETKVLVPVDLNTLVAHEPVAHEAGFGGSAVVTTTSGPAIVVATSQPQTPASFATYLVAAQAPFILLASSLVVDVTPPEPIKGLRTGGNLVASWTDSSLLLHRLVDERLQHCATLPLAEILDVLAMPSAQCLVVRQQHTVLVYRLAHETSGEVELSFLTSTPAAGVEHVGPLDAHSALLARTDDEDHRSLDLLALSSPPSSEASPNSQRSPLEQLYRSAPPPPLVKITAITMLGVGRILAGDSDGGLHLLDISALASLSALPEPKVQLTGAITLLDVVEFGGRQIVLAGTSTGGAGAWGLSDWDLVGRWQLFASPVKHFAFIDSAASTTSRTSNSIIFISANSPVALVSLFPPRVVFTLPGTKSAVEVVATNKDEILVLYEQGLARTCDIASKELRRSMDRKTAEGVLDNGSWKIWFRLRDAPSPCPAHPHLSLDLRSLIDESASQLPWSRARAVKPSAPDTPDASPDPSKPPSVDGATASIVDGRTIARSLTAVLATFGVDEAMDELLGQLGIDPPTVSLVAGLGSAHASSLGAYGQPTAPWTLSPVATAHRLLELVCLLRVFLNYPDTERVASEAVVYLASCLGDTVGPDFCPPSLDVLAQFWLDKNAEVQQAARSLFGTYLAAMPDDHILALVESWQDQLPARQQDGGVLHHRADHALLMIGLIATERFKLLSSSILVDVAESVALSLEDEEHPYHQAVAAELCSRGFGIWQNYVDAMRLVRQLFAIAIGRNPATPNDLRLLARNATLHVAGINTSLFMTTLLHDVLNASTASARNATLKLLGFIIRKKPLVLYSNLPRVVEAVVKSLDPNVSSLREAVQQTATAILHELVHSFPSVDFHGKSQRLAVGTNEGVAIVFDLRTATRLYVLEGHARPITALSWSPDGHRLVTVSLDESRVLAWRVSGGLLSMFMAGTPARQGSGSGATPFKTYDFHVGDEALMTTQATLEWVRFDWPAERTVRLRIRESALNFGV